MSRLLDNEALQGYVDRVLETQRQRDEALARDDLRQIALELGLSETDLDWAAEQAEAHFVRGQGYYDHELWDDAIRELEAAAGLEPVRLDILELLAQAHLTRYTIRGRQADKDACTAYARRCLDIDPAFQPAFRLLNELNRPTTTMASGQAAGQRSAPGGLAFVAVILIGLGLLGTSFRRQGPAQPLPEPAPQTVSAAVPNAATNPAPAPGSWVSTDGLPVSLVENEPAKGLTGAVRLSQQTGTLPKSWYKVHYQFTNELDHQVTEIKCLIEVLGSEGQVIATDATAVHGTHHAPLRQGDHMVFTRTIPVAAQAAGARITVQSTKAEPVPSELPTVKIAGYSWGFEQPAGARLNIVQREAVNRAASNGDRHYVNAVFAVTNDGDAALQTLKFQLRIKDADGNLLETREFFAAYGGGVPLERGETRLVRTLASVDTKPTQYELVIIDCR